MSVWVLLRGWARERRHWESFPDLFGRQLRGDDEIIALDLPGNGELHRDASPACVAAMVEAYRSQLGARQIRGRVRLLGLSLGAMVALEWAHRYPHEVDSAVLVNGSAGGHAAPWERLRPRAWPALARLALPGTSALRREQGVLALCSNLRGAELAQRWAGYAADRPTSIANAARQLFAAAAYRAPRAAPAVRLLVIASAADRLVAPRCSIRLARQWDLQLLMHPSAGHDLAVDAPAWLARTCARWAPSHESRTVSRN
jgi:pimeloyl-ACP methyl ester carboxylesterase